MGCNSSTAVGVVDPKLSKEKKGKARPPTPGPKSISFVVELDDDNKLSRSASIKSKLPKRLQRLKEENCNLLTAQEIAEKQKLAEKRRKSAIEERVLKSQQFLAKVQAANRSGKSSPANSDSGRGSRISIATVKIEKT